MTRRAHAGPAMMGGALLAVAALAACESERSTVFEPVGPAIFDFAVSPGRAKLPSGTTAGQVLYYYSRTTSDLGGGADFSRQLVPRTRIPTGAGWSRISEAIQAETVSVAPLATETSFAFTPPGRPGRDGFTGQHLFNFSVGQLSSLTNLFVRVVLVRVDAAGVVQTTQSPLPAEQALTGTGTVTFNTASLNLGPWNVGDRLRVEFRFRNSSGTTAHTVIFSTGQQALTIPTRSLTLTLGDLPALSGQGRYQFWLVGRDTQNLDVAVPAFGPLTEFFSRVDTLPNGDTLRDPTTNDPLLTTDSTVVSLTPQNAYAGSNDSNVTWLRAIIDSTGDNGTPVAYHAVVVTREDAVATAPGPVRFLWHRTGLVRMDTTASMFFGEFGGSDLVNIRSPADYVYAVVGSGQGGARGPEISVDVREIPRPPRGFFYRAFLVSAAGTSLLVDTLRSAWSPDSSISRVSLYNADVNPLLPGVVGRAVRAAQIRNCASGSGTINCQNTLALPDKNTFKGYTRFQLKLEPKGVGATTHKSSVSHAGDLPDEVK